MVARANPTIPGSVWAGLSMAVAWSYLHLSMDTSGEKSSAAVNLSYGGTGRGGIFYS